MPIAYYIVLLFLNLVISFAWGQYFGTFGIGTTWYINLQWLAIGTMVIMQLDPFRRNEDTILTLFTFDTGLRPHVGTCPTPCLVPFLKGLGILNFGFGSDVSGSSRPVISNPEYGLDQRIPIYSAQVRTNSFLAADVNRAKNLLLREIFSPFDRFGRLEYWKLGRIIFLFVFWPAIFIGNHFAPVDPLRQINSVTLNENKMEEISTEGTNEQRQKEIVSILVFLKKNTSPIIPSADNFVPRVNGNLTKYTTKFVEDSRPYYHFIEPVPGKISTIKVTEPLCAIIPLGREINFLTNKKPSAAVNVIPYVTYIKKRARFDIFDYMQVIVDFNINATSLLVTKSWEDVYDTWYGEDYRMIATMATSPSKLHPESPSWVGGIVCFD